MACAIEYIIPNVGDADPFVPSTIVDSLKKDIMFQVKKIMLSKRMPTNLSYTSFWYNAYYEGQGQEPHNHLSVPGQDPFWCGIYFAKNCFPGSLFFIRQSIHIGLNNRLFLTNTNGQILQ